MLVFTDLCQYSLRWHCSVQSTMNFLCSILSTHWASTFTWSIQAIICFSSTDDCKLSGCKSKLWFKSTTSLDHGFRDSHTVSSQWILPEFNRSEDWACDLKNCSAMNLWFGHHLVSYHIKFFCCAQWLHCFVSDVCNSVHIYHYAWTDPSWITAKN